MITPTDVFCLLNDFIQSRQVIDYRLFIRIYELFDHPGKHFEQAVVKLFINIAISQRETIAAFHIIDHQLQHAGGIAAGFLVIADRPATFAQFDFFSV